MHDYFKTNNENFKLDEEIKKIDFGYGETDEEINKLIISIDFTQEV